MNILIIFFLVFISELSSMEEVLCDVNKERISSDSKSGNDSLSRPNELELEILEPKESIEKTNKELVLNKPISCYSSECIEFDYLITSHRRVTTTEVSPVGINDFKWEEKKIKNKFTQTKQTKSDHSIELLSKQKKQKKADVKKIKSYPLVEKKDKL